MVDHVRVMTAALKMTSAKKAFTMEGLWRLAAWGAAAACAMLIAVLTTRGEVAAGRRPVAVASMHRTTMPPPLSVPVKTEAISRPAADADAETRQLSEAIRGLVAQNDELQSRVAAIEHTMDDVTGSIARQNAATKPGAKTQTTQTLLPWPDNGPPLPPTTATMATVLAPAMPVPTEYGVDIGSALSIPTLRARWTGIRAAHPTLFEGLRPVVILKRLARTNRVELRLLAGPLGSAEAAAQLCADLVPYRLYCQPTIFIGQHLALE